MRRVAPNRLAEPAGHARDPGAPASNLLIPTVYHEPWLLDAATGGRFEEVEVRQAGVVVGRFPFIRRGGMGITFSTMPALTHFLGPAIAEGAGSACTRALKRNSIIRDLLDQMPESDGFMHRMHAGITDMLAFQHTGFSVGVEFTYEIDAAPTATLWRAMRDKTRNVIRRASEQFRVEAISDPDEFVSFYQANLEARGKSSYYDAIAMAAVGRAAISRGRGRIIGAKDEAGRLRAAIFTLSDPRTAYYYLSTRALGAHNGAISLLLWQAIQDATNRGLTFDFDGVGTPESVLLFAGFGGATSPRYVAARFNRRYRLATRARELWNRLADRSRRRPA